MKQPSKPPTERPKALDVLVDVTELALAYRYSDRAATISDMARVVSTASRLLRFADAAAEQDGNVLESDAGTLLDFGDDQMRQVRVGAAEVEMEFHLAHLTRPHGRGAGARFQA
jgi:hypothetical protein